jgi:hypothetical protein
MTYTKEQRMFKSLTPTQRDALLWLHDNGGTVIRMKWPRHTQVMARGVIAPYLAVTYTWLEKRGLCQWSGNVATITMSGHEVAKAATDSKRDMRPAPDETQKRAFNPVDLDKVDKGDRVAPDDDYPGYNKDGRYIE